MKKINFTIEDGVIIAQWDGWIDYGLFIGSLYTFLTNRLDGISILESQGNEQHFVLIYPKGRCGFLVETVSGGFSLGLLELLIQSKEERKEDNLFFSIRCGSGVNKLPIVKIKSDIDE